MGDHVKAWTQRRLRSFPMELALFALLAMVSGALAISGHTALAGLLVFGYIVYWLVSGVQDWLRLTEARRLDKQNQGQRGIDTDGA